MTEPLDEPVAGPGFLCKATDACGKPDLLAVVLGGTFAVSFLPPPERARPSTDGDLGVIAATDADGMTGARGAIGGGAANEGGFGTPGGTATTEGGFGAAGVIPGIEGGFGAVGGTESPPGGFGATGAMPGGFGAGGSEDASPPDGDSDSGAPGF